jgi:CRISPR-associated endonuclease/helicase Cas3
MNSFLAHSGNLQNGADGQLLIDHLTQVGHLAKKFAEYTPLADHAQVAGLLHDLGKYSAEFQARLKGNPQRVNHSTAGAVEAIKQYGKLGKLLAFAIAGHHAGLANGVDDGNARSALQQRLKEQIPSLDSSWKSELQLPVQLKPPVIKPRKDFEGFQLAFLIRMLFSCLVDADYIDTDEFYRKLEGKLPRVARLPDLIALRTQLDAYLAQLRSAQSSSSSVHELRQHILQNSRERAALAPGLFTLTVPTGGGKTLTSMAFALDHALMHDLRRVIYVIPFTSIIEQNAKVFRDAFGELGAGSVLEHHSAFEDAKLPDKTSRDKLKVATENWDAPVVVTTAVQFFESLFADRSSACRKLHNIAGSVIILDEAQMLPLTLLRPTMAAIDELARNYQCSIVLCTATQPALSSKVGFYNGFDEVREIAPNPPKLFEQLARVNVSHIGIQTDEQLLEHLQKNEQVLIIVNNRRHARALFDTGKDLQGIRHLTTLMCAKHRSQVLEEIRADLKAGRSCRVISTSLIEAGVDVDFPCVLRAEAGLDSIAQAAGRCNRNGLRDKAASPVSVFQSPDWKAPAELDQLAASMREVIRNHSGDLLSPEALQFYFELTYRAQGTNLDKKKILEGLQAHAPSFDFAFQNIARDYKLIESHMTPVIVPFDMRAERLIYLLSKKDSIASSARKLQPYIVQIPETGLKQLLKAGAVELVAPDKLGHQFWRLVNPDLYDKLGAGLSWNDPTFLKAESTII